MKTVILDLDILSKDSCLTLARNFQGRYSTTIEPETNKLTMKIIDVNYDEFIGLVQEYESHMEEYGFHLATINKDTYLFQGKSVR